MFNGARAVNHNLQRDEMPMGVSYRVANWLASLILSRAIAPAIFSSGGLDRRGIAGKLIDSALLPLPGLGVDGENVLSPADDPLGAVWHVPVDAVESRL